MSTTKSNLNDGANFQRRWSRATTPRSSWSYLKRHNFPTRILKSLWTAYLFSAICYTTIVIFILPVVNIILKGPLTHPKATVDFNFSPLRAPNIQIVPRLLPNHANSQSLDHKNIRKNLKGTSVNTDEVIAEDDASLWTTKTSKVTVKVASPPTSFRRNADGLPIPPRSALKNLDPSHTEKIDWYPESQNFSRSYEKKDQPLKSIRKEIYSTSEDFFLSKAFGDSLGPSKIIPFFYKALGPKNDGQLNKRDISITTLVTSNRFRVFSRLVENYQGPISATIHVSDSPSTLKSLLESIDELYRGSKSMSTWVDIHLVVDSFDRQFNMWRNVAKFFARTDFVMMLDVDFWICTNFRQRILNSPNLINRLDAGGSAFVIPAFEYTKQSDGVNPDEFPTSKPGLMKLVSLGQIGMFHKSWQPGHGSTNYTRFYLADQQEEIYPTSQYSHSYEPYVVYKKDKTPYCDERFIGYGANKAACIFELFLSGVSFYVLPQDFLVHQSHAYAEKTRHHERRFNRQLYSDFREEVCFRYLNQFLKFNSINEKGLNMLHECNKIKGFSPAATRLAQFNRVAINFDFKT